MNRPSAAFQFQHGTIERAMQHSPSATSAEFQFQHGTIERILNAAPILLAPSYFNSNMVRLRVIEANAKLMAASPFQFQHGTIESIRSKYKITVCFDFNSNMVRLRESAGLLNLMSP